MWIQVRTKTDAATTQCGCNNWDVKEKELWLNVSINVLKGGLHIDTQKKTQKKCNNIQRNIICSSRCVSEIKYMNVMKKIFIIKPLFYLIQLLSYTLSHHNGTRLYYIIFDYYLDLVWI